MVLMLFNGNNLQCLMGVCAVVLNLCILEVCCLDNFTPIVSTLYIEF